MKKAFAAIALVLTMNVFAAQTFECTTADNSETAYVTVNEEQSNIQIENKNYDSYVLNLRPTKLKSYCPSADISDSSKGTIVQYASPDVSFLIYVDGSKSLAVPGCTSLNCKRVR